MDNLILNKVGIFGDLRQRPNPDGFILRSQYDPLDFHVNTVVEMNGSILDAPALADAVDKMPVIACLSNVDDPRFPFLAHAVEHSEYLRRIDEVKNNAKIR